MPKSVPEEFVKLMLEFSVEEAVTTFTRLPWETVEEDTGVDVVFEIAKYKKNHDIKISSII